MEFTRGKIGEHRNAKRFHVYLIENSINSNVYIGITSRSVEVRFAEHIYHSNKSNNHCVHLYPAMQKYGTDKFSARLIDVSDTWKGACELEKFYIKKFDSYKNGYNASLGGDGLSGFKWSIEKRLNVFKKHGDIKVCATCKIEKPIEMFGTRNHAHRGDFIRRPVSECKECARNRTMKYVSKDRNLFNFKRRIKRHRDGVNKTFKPRYKHEEAFV